MEDKREEEAPKWMNFICPSCAVAYGISALISAIKKRKVSQSMDQHE